MLIERNLDEGGSGVANKSVTLFVIGILEEFLAEVVAKRI